MAVPAGQSMFLQIPVAAKTQALFGTITSAGAITGNNSGGFTVSRNSAGLYTVTFTSAFADAQYVVKVQMFGPGFPFPIAGTKATGSVQIQTDNASQVATDSAFMFWAAGLAA